MRPLRIVLVLVVALAAVAVVVRAITPSIDPSVASLPIARTALTGPVSPDVTEGPNGELGPDDLSPASPRGGECLDRIVRGSGWVDLCWQASRLGNDADPEKDYYLLRVYGSHEGLRWAVVQSQLLDRPGDDVFDAWPASTYEGACRREDVIMLIPMSALTTEYVCGHTQGRPDFADWSHRVTWRCEGCLLPDATTRGIALYNVVGVPAGTVPRWDLFADAGG